MSWGMRTSKRYGMRTHMGIRNPRGYTWDQIFRAWYGMEWHGVMVFSFDSPARCGLICSGPSSDNINRIYTKIRS